MNIKVLDTYSGEKVWSSEIDADDICFGGWSCDCMRATLFNPRRTCGCADGGDCRGYERWIVIDRFCVNETDDSELPTMHECNYNYPEELLVVNGVELD